MDKLYIRVELDGTISLISTVNGFISDAIEIENYPIEFLSNFTNYLFLNGEIIERQAPTAESLFDFQLCINVLFRRFITSLSTYSDVSSTLVDLLQAKKPDNDGKYFNYFWCIRIYLVQCLQASKISQADYDRVLTAFTEQNINLEDY